MERNIDAVFYEFKYYIFPDEFADINNIADGTTVKAKRLFERECMAPDFIYESFEEESLEITNAAHLFPVKVNIYSAKEYNAILLKQIKRVCPGCLRYNDDGDDEHLNGHHREISLNGTCYEREDDEEIVPYATRVGWFYHNLSNCLEELAECIEKNQQSKLNKICQKCAKCILAPEKFFGTKKDGKYVLYMQCSYSSDLCMTMLAYTAYCSSFEENPLNKAGWAVIPFIPEGAGGYKGKIKKNTVIGKLVRSDVPWKYYLKVFSGKDLSEKDKAKLADDIYRYICFELGEDRVQRVFDGMEFESEEGNMTAGEVCEKLRGADENLPNSFPPALPYGWENKETSTPYKKTLDGVSSCFTFANIGADSSLCKEVNFANEMAYAYLYIPVLSEDSDAVYETLSYYLGGEALVPEPVLLKDEFIFSFYRTGISECTNGDEFGIAFDFFVADEKCFYRFIKILAPVLSAYNAKLVVINSAGINEYVCGTDIYPADGGEAN